MSDVGGNTTAKVGDPGGGLDFRLLGSVEVAVGASEIPIGSVKQRALLAMLVLHLNTVVSADRLIDVLWGEHPPPSALPTLRSLVARLRRTLDTAGVSTAEAVVRGKGAGYLLRAAAGRVDALRFSALVEQARHAFAQGQADMAARDLRAALALWRGPALEDLSQWAFAQIEAQRLNEERATAVEDLAEAELALGRPAEALTRLEPLLEANPLRERGWSQLMVALYRLGRQADALTAYQRVRAILADELGIDPSPSLRELHEQLLRQSPDLDRPPNLDRHRPASPPNHSSHGTQTTGDSESQRAPDRARHNLPATLTSFVGRTQELSDLDALPAMTRLITLTGVGGVGKTRLAVQYALAASGRYPDGVRLIEFAAIRDPGLVVPATATGIGFIPSELESTGQPLQEALCGRLAGRHMLLVLDNCEHLLDPISHLAQALLASCRNVTVLATSRETLAIPGESVFQVPPLSLPLAATADGAESTGCDAVRLFCDRARLAEPSFRLTSANADAVTHICQRLDGIPLALELAAARIRALGAQQLAERLTDRLRLLATVARVDVPRHQTLRAAIDWSYQLLSPPEQSMLASLSVFPGTFDLDVAEAINTVGDQPSQAGFESLDLLARLIDKSLVVVTKDADEVRYRLLETIREYASEKLVAAGLGESTRRRHRDHFLAVANSYPYGFGSETWAPRIRRGAADLDNFRAALSWSRSHGDTEALVGLAAMLSIYWATTGGTEGLEWLEHAAATTGPAPLTACAEVRGVLALALRTRGGEHRSRCMQLAEEAVATATQAGDLNAVGCYNVFACQLAVGVAQLERAEHFAREAEAAYRAGGSPSMQGAHHHPQAWIHIHRGEYRQAREHLLALGEIDRLEENEWLFAEQLADLSLVSVLCGDIGEVDRLAEQAVRVARRLPACEKIINTLTRAAQASLLSGNTSEARGFLTDLLGVLRDLGFQRWVADALEMTAIVLVEAEPTDTATLLGAAGSLRDYLAETPAPFITDDLNRCRQSATETLGPENYGVHERHGRNMTTHEALTYGLRALRGDDDDVTVDVPRSRRQPT